MTVFLGAFEPWFAWMRLQMVTKAAREREAILRDSLSSMAQSTYNGNNHFDNNSKKRASEVHARGGNSNLSVSEGIRGRSSSTPSAPSDEKSKSAGKLSLYGDDSTVSISISNSSSSPSSSVSSSRSSMATSDLSISSSDRSDWNEDEEEEDFIDKEQFLLYIPVEDRVSWLSVSLTGRERERERERRY